MVILISGIVITGTQDYYQQPDKKVSKHHPPKPGWANQ